MSYHFRIPPRIALLLPLLVVIVPALLTAPPVHGSDPQMYKVKDGFYHDGEAYWGITTFDLNALDNTRKVSSTATVKGGHISNTVYVTGSSGGSADTFATSLHMTFENSRIYCTRKNIVCYFYIQYLPPNTFLLFKGTRSEKTDIHRSIAVQTGWEYNATVSIVNSELTVEKGNTVEAIRTYAPPVGAHTLMDNCVLHIKKMKVIAHGGLIRFEGTLEKQSAFVFEDIHGIDLRGTVLSLDQAVIKDHSAIIVMDLRHTNVDNWSLTPFLHTELLHVDETSVFSLIDITASNMFKGEKPMFSWAIKITGGGEIVFSRLSMQKSGMPSLQPEDNTNFWVSARMSANDDLTVAQLKEQNFNVNDKNVYNWDGTGAGGKMCAPVGASIPGRAMYARDFINGMCTATCKEGFIPPACNEPTKNPCRVDNCDLCYRVTKTKCMLCAAHTSLENNDQRCRCPASLANCQVCPSATTCSKCVQGYIPSANQRECYSCPDANCLHCSSNAVCDACAPHYNLSAIGATRNRCISCKVPNCLLCKEDDTCDTCATGYTKPEGKGTCVHCPIDRCERCDTDGVCAQCSDKNTLANGKHCYACTMPGCLACDGDEQCAQCDAKHTLVGTNCVSCDIPNCTSCLVDGVCDQCEPKYTLHNDGANSQCIPCAIDGCSTCDADSHCSVCANGNPVDDGKECVSCDVSNCVHCNATDSCAECSDRHSLFNDAGKLECISCNVDHCAFCSATDTCQQCEATYNISKTGDKCAACIIDGCQRCDEDGVCALCGTNQSVSLNDAGCTPCAIGNCTSCSASGKCGICKCGMVPTNDGKECVSCTAEHCRVCDLPGNGKKCAVCDKGYDESDGVCRKVHLPSWGVFLIVVAATIILVASLCLGVFLYLRHQQDIVQEEENAVERRRNRQSAGCAARRSTIISIVDLADIEHAASGIRDNTTDNKIIL